MRYRASVRLPWVPEVFLACGGNFRCRAGHYKDLTETGNRARKVSGTQGSVRSIKMTEYRSLSSFLAFFLSARVRFILPARAVAKQTVLCTHFDRLVFDNT